MYRVAMILATAGLIAVGMLATPARAHDGWWGYSEWRESPWREHEWREREWHRHWWHQQHRYWDYGYGAYAPSTYYRPGSTVGFDFR